MKDGLFRPEVLEARRNSWLGGISLVQPPSFWLLTCAAVLAASAIIFFLMLGEYTRRSRVVGQLVPDLGLSTVVAPVDGVLVAQMPAEGERVMREEALAVIAVPRATIGNGNLADGLQEELEHRQLATEQAYAAQQALLTAQASGYRLQLASVRRELEQVEAAASTRREQLRLAEETLARFKELEVERFVGAVEVHRAERDVLEQTSNLQSTLRQATALQRDVVRLEQLMREIPAQHSALAAENANELAHLQQERIRVESSGELLVQAPISGLIASRLVEPGQSVRAGQPLLSLLPAGATLQAQLLVPSHAVGFMEPGDPVLLRYQAFPHQKFGHHRGSVARISRSALTPLELGALLGTPQGEESYYRVLVDLSRQSIQAYGRPEPLRPGMRLEADILGEKRKLYEWVLEPLYSLSGRL